MAAVGSLIVLIGLIASPRGAGAGGRGPAPSRVQATSRPDISHSVFVYESFARDQPGCGAISAFDVRTGEVFYRGPSWAGHGDLAGSPDLSTVLATWNQGGAQTMYRLDAGAESPVDWRADRLRLVNGRHRISGSGTVAILPDGDRFVVGLSGLPDDGGNGAGFYRLSDVGSGEAGHLGDQYGFYAMRAEAPRVVLPGRDQDIVHILSHESRLPATLTDTVKSQAANLHTVDTRTMAAPISTIRLPDIVVDDPPGAGLREAGIHATVQHGNIGYATMLPDGDPRLGGPGGSFVAVSRWGVPELAIVFVRTGQVRITRLASDLPVVSGIAANRGWANPGLVAVHAGDRIAIYHVDPYAPTAIELARVPITPPMGPHRGEPKMMGGQIAWSSDGSRIIASANEGTAEFVVLDVAECGRRLRPAYYVTACDAEGFNGGRGLLTAVGQPDRRPDAPQTCPTPHWWFPSMQRVPVLLPLLANAYR